jgi:hypothetical protein
MIYKRHCDGIKDIRWFTRWMELAGILGILAGGQKFEHSP